MNTPGRLPTFLVIGAMRAGSSSLNRYLARNTEVYMAPGKELRFFDRNFDKGFDWYQQRFSPEPHQVAIGEATPGYVYSRVAMERIAETLPHVKLIMSVRDPVDRAYSHYWLNRALAKEPLSFEEAIVRELKLPTIPRPGAGKFSYLDRSRYVEHLRVVLGMFPKESLHVFLFEDLRDDPAGTLRRVFEVIGARSSSMNWDETFSPVNAYTQFRSLRLRRVARRWPRSVRRLVGKLNTMGSPSYPQMSAQTRQELEGMFEDSNRALAKEFGLDISSWA